MKCNTTKKVPHDKQKCNITEMQYDNVSEIRQQKCKAPAEVERKSRSAKNNRSAKCNMTKNCNTITEEQYDNRRCTMHNNERSLSLHTEREKDLCN